MASLAEIRAKLLEQDSKSNGNNRSQGSGDNQIFTHWNINEGDTATLRFLPDSDESNTFFWKERQMIRLEFSGVKGGDENKPVTIQVPCIETWGDTCPVHAEIRPWFKDPSMEDMARRFWKKRSYIFQGFVPENPLQEEAPANPIRRFVISPQIFKIISAALMDPEFQELPTDYEMGTDFKVVKGKKGQYADYGTSNWARRERSLNEAEREAINTHGLYNLNDFLPKKPDAEHLNAIFEMFEASVDGQLYDPERFANYYRPYGVDAPSSGPRPMASAPVAAPAPVAQAAPVAETVTDTGWVDAAPTPEADTGKASAQDILAAIRSRPKT